MWIVTFEKCPYLAEIGAGKLYVLHCVSISIFRVETTMFKFIRKAVNFMITIPKLALLSV